MKRIWMIFMIVAMTLVVGCGPAKIDKYVDIKPHETAFVVPMTGANLSSQKGFGSINYLESRKIAAKRIFLKQSSVATGRMPGSYKWILDSQVITVSRAAVALEWKDDHAIRLESSDSIAFSLGGTITGHITEEDTAKFLYNYPSSSLGAILNNEVKAFITSEMSSGFGTKALDDCRTQKSEISKGAFEKAKTFFKDEKGITLDVFGISGGLTYDDKDIQSAINRTFEAAMSVNAAKEDAKRSFEEKTKLENVAEGHRLAAVKNTDALTYDIREKAKAEADAIKKVTKALSPSYIKYMEAQAKMQWNGVLPAKLTNVGDTKGGMILQLAK